MMLRLVACCLVVAVLAATVAADEDFYDILDLPEKEEATERDIKKQFRKLSKALHPDQNPSEREKYQKIQRANEVLSDRRKRKIYDMRGEEGLKLLEDSGRQQKQNDPFAAMFGGGQQQGNQHKGQDVQMRLGVALADVYSGKHTQVTLEKQKLCRKCKGLGAASKKDLTKCSHCKGKGVVNQRVQIMPGFVQEQRVHCPHCGGKGKTIKTKCPACNGNKVFRGEHRIEIEIEQGVPEGHRIVFDMEGDQSPDLIPGDIIFLIESEKDKTFVRKGINLEMDLTITLKQALLGFSKSVTHMDGHHFVVSNSGITRYGQKVTMTGEGMPKHNVPSEKGDLVVTCKVELPKSLTADQKAALSDVFGYTYKPTEAEDAGEDEDDDEM
jgi:DnaJ-class molecular chaperone